MRPSLKEEAETPDAPEVRADGDLVELVRRAQWKDAAAFSELIRRYERIALSIAHATLNHSDRAGDIVQEAFVRAWERLPELKEPARFGPWLCGVVRNLAIDARRRLRLQPRAQTDVSPDAMPDSRSDTSEAPGPLDALEARERQTLVADALAELDDTSRPVVMLRYYEGLSSKEIGTLLDLAPTAVDMRLSRARQQLKKKLAPLVALA